MKFAKPVDVSIAANAETYKHVENAVKQDIQTTDMMLSRGNVPSGTRLSSTLSGKDAKPLRRRQRQKNLRTAARTQT